MRREEMLKKMQGICDNGRSQLRLRSESIQNPFSRRRIPTLKKALKKRSKLLLFTDLAIPFNPETGEEDEVYNVDNKYRPPFSATTVALSLKELADSNPTTKEAFMRRAGVSEWDTSDYDTFTEQDRAVFIKYRVPRIFTVPAVHVNIPVMTKNSFGRDYALSVDRDPITGEIIGEIPGVLKVNKFFRDKLYEEVQEYQKQIDSGELVQTEKQRKDTVSNIYSKNPVSDVRPSNWVTMIELPLTNQYKLSGDVDITTADAAKIRELVVLSRRNSEIRTTLEKYVAGDFEKFDKYFDFFELDMSCPTEGDDQSDNGRMLLGKDTKFEKPTYQLDELIDENSLSKVFSTVREYLDDNVHIEEEVRRSMYISPYTEEVENQIYSSLETVVDIENDKYITQDVLKANREVISIAFAEVGDALLDELDAGCSNALPGDLDEEASAEMAKDAEKRYSIAELDDDDDGPSLDIEEVALG